MALRCVNSQGPAQEVWSPMRLEGIAQNPQEPAVYFVQSGADGPIKIGRVTRYGLLHKRIADLQVASPYPLVLLRTIQGGAELERQLHDRFAQSRLSGEWFFASDDLVAFIGDQATMQQAAYCDVVRAEAFALGDRTGYERGYREGYLNATESVRALLAKLPVQPEDWRPISEVSVAEHDARNGATSASSGANL